MGKATIKTNLGEGQYLVDVALNTGMKAPALAEHDRMIAAGEAHIPIVQAALEKQEAETARLQAVKAGIIVEIEAVQGTYRAKLGTLNDNLDSANTAVSNAQIEVDDAAYLLALTQSSLAALEAEKAAVEALPPPDNIPSPALLAEIALAQAEILLNQADLDANKTALADAKKSRDGIQSQIDNLKNEIPKDLIDKMAAVIAEIQTSQYAERLFLQDKVKTLLDIKDYQLKKVELAKLPDTKEVSAWCADYSTTLAGDVATIEVAGEVGAVPILLKPAFEVPSFYDSKVDGGLVNLELMSPEQAWFNLCTLPYLNKWKPRFRRGHITSITGDLCEVALEETFTKYHPIEVTPKGKAVLKAVPFVYMECNSDAFEVGDFVVVQFTDRDPNKPKVVGFVENPRECNFHGFGIKSGETVRLIQKKAAVWKIRDRPTLKYGTLYRKLQIGATWTVVSFDGPTAGVMVGPRPGWAGDIAAFTTATIYTNGQSLSAPGKVEGLGLCNIGGAAWVYIVANFSIYRAGIPVRVNARTVLNWELMGSFGPPYDYELYITNNPAWAGIAVQASLWEFNAACTEVAAVFGSIRSATVIGRWTGYDTLALEWFDPSAGSVPNVSSYFKFFIWCGFVSDGVTLDVISELITNVLYYDTFAYEYTWGIDTEYLKFNEENLFLLIQSDGVTATVLRYLILKYLDPSIMAYAVVGYDGETPYCDILKDNVVILSGDNLSKWGVPPNFDKFSTLNSAWVKSINNDTAYSQIDKNHYQVIVDTNGNILACIYDYSYVSSMYEFFYGYTKAALITGGDIHTLAGTFDTIMPIGLI